MPIQRITKEELKTKLEGDPAGVPVLIDVRLKYPYEHSTVKLPGAIRVMPDAPDFSAVPAGRDVVAYDSDPDELVSSRIAGALIRKGYRVSVLKGGISEWMAASFPVDTKDAPKQAPPPPGALKG